MTTREKILLVSLCAVLLVVALSWRLWLIALASRWRLPPSYGSKPRKGPIVRGIRTVLAAPFAVLAFALVTVAMFSARAAMWISAGYRGAVKVEAEL
ncbi:MAG: hypothetical protein E6532_08435 [Bifidobacterium longum]|nr:hypothetical protein [Bifidobacterium longum]